MKKMLLLFVTSMVLTSTAQEKVTLRYNFKEGDAYEIKMKMKQEMGAIMAQTTEITMSQKTVSATNDSFTIESKIERMKLDMIQGSSVINYDSNKSDEELDETGKMMKAQVGPFLTVTLTNKMNGLGEVTDVVVEPKIPGVENMTKQTASVIYPEEALQVGSSWEMTNSEGGMDFKMIYSVKEITNSNVLLTISGNVSGMASGSIDGKMNVDRTSGVPTSSELEMKMDVQGQEMITKVEGSYTKK